MSYNDLGDVEHGLGNFEAAKDWLLKCIDIQQTTLGNAHLRGGIKMLNRFYPALVEWMSSR